MSLAIIVFIFLVLFGSVYWLKPSPRDKRLADLRFSAIKHGLIVKQHTFTPDSKKTGVRDAITGTTYTLFSQDQKAEPALLMRIMGQAGWDTDSLPEGYSWHDGHSQLAGTDVLAQIGFAEALANIPDHLHMVEIYGNRVSIMPAEMKGVSAEQYVALLEFLMDHRDVFRKAA